MRVKIITITPNDYEMLSDADKLVAMGRAVSNIHTMLLIMSQALMHFGSHEKDCHSHKKGPCDCGFDDVTETAKLVLSSNDEAETMVDEMVMRNSSKH
jgi:hypothetical protein